jgi:hypothetical protein
MVRPKNGCVTSVRTAGGKALKLAQMAATHLWMALTRFVGNTEVACGNAEVMHTCDTRSGLEVVCGNIGRARRDEAVQM